MESAKLSPEEQAKADIAQEKAEQKEREKQELDALKARAKVIGLQHSPNIGAPALAEKIKEHLEKADKEKEAKEPEVPAEPVKETRQARRRRLHKEASRMHRVRIYNMNPNKADLEGEIFTVGNGVTGTYRKFIPFGEATDNGYHVEEIILNEMKARKFQQINTRKVSGQIQVDTRLAPEFNIVELPPLTRAELDELGLKQAAAERIGA